MLFYVDIVASQEMYLHYKTSYDILGNLYPFNSTSMTAAHKLSAFSTRGNI